MDHSNDDENRWDTALGHVMAFINEDREKIANGDSGRNPQYGEGKMARIKNPDLYSLRESMKMLESNAFVLNSQTNDLRLHRRKKRSNDCNLNVFSSIFTTEQPIQYTSANTEVILKELGKAQTNASPGELNGTEVWSNRAKLKFVTVRPWNQFCLTCDDRNNLKDDRRVKAYHSGHTKRKKTNTPYFHFKNLMSTTALNPPWLFYSGPVKTRKSAESSSTEAIASEKNVPRPNLNFGINSHVENFLVFRSRNKKRNSFLQRALKRQKKDKSKNGFISYMAPLTTFGSTRGGADTAEKNKLYSAGKNIFRNNLYGMDKLKKRSSTLIENEKINDLVGFIPLGGSKHKNNKGIPSCQKSSLRNLTYLVNAQTIKPNEYFQDKPALRLSCEDCVSVGNTSSTTPAANVTSSDKSSFTDGMTGSKLDLNNSTNFGTTSNMSTVSSPGTTPTILQMFKQVRTLPANGTIHEKPKDKFNLHISSKNKNDLIYLNVENPESKIESIPKPLYYLVSFQSNDTFEDIPSIGNMIKTGTIKKIQPWDKFCPCSGGKLSTLSDGSNSLNRRPWASACSVCISTNGDNNNNGEGVEKMDVDSAPVSTASHVSVLQIISKPLEEEDNSEELSTNHSRSHRKSLLLLRIPIAGAEAPGKNGSWVFFLPFNRTTNSNHVMPRSILDMFVPSLWRRSTIRPMMHVVKPWEEPWKFRQEKFNLFTTSECEMNGPCKQIHNPCTMSDETPLISKSLLEYIAETCPSCSKTRKVPAFNSSDQLFDGIETDDDLPDEEMGIENSACDDLSNEKSDFKYTPGLLTLPDVHLIEDTPPPLQKVKSLEGLTIFKSQDSPPKYFIEIPGLWSRLRDLARSARSTSLPPVTQCKARQKTSESGRKKIVILHPQPFDINGNNVYLPSDIDVPVEEELSTTDRKELEEQTANPRYKFFGKDKNDPLLPFVLVPAYLAMHPRSTSPHWDHKTDSSTNVFAQLHSLLYGDSGDSNSKNKKIPVEQLPNTLSENKPIVFTKQLRHTPPIAFANRAHVTKKPLRKHLSGRSSAVSSKPTFIILMNGMSDSRNPNGAEFSLNKDDFSFMNQKGAVTIETIGDYIVI